MRRGQKKDIGTLVVGAVQLHYVPKTLTLLVL